MLIYFRPNVNKTSRRCRLAACRNTKQRNHWGWTGGACLTSNYCSFPHSSQLSRTSTSSSIREGSPGCQSTLGQEEQPRTSVFILLGCSHRVSAALSHLQRTWKNRLGFLQLWLCPGRSSGAASARAEEGKVEGAERQLYIQYTHSNLLLWKTICFSVLQSSEGKL